MKLDDAIRTLSKYNQWRSGQMGEKSMLQVGICHSDITEAIDSILVWYGSPESYCVDLINRMLERLEETGNYAAVCESARAYLKNQEGNDE